MRTTINLDARLLGTVKGCAQERGLTLGDFIAEAVQVYLARPRQNEQMRRLPIFSGTGAAPGIELSSSAAMYATVHADEDAA